LFLGGNNQESFCSLISFFTEAGTSRVGLNFSMKKLRQSIKSMKAVSRGSAKQGILMVPAGHSLASGACVHKELTCVYAARTWAFKGDKTARDVGQVKTRQMPEASPEARYGARCLSRNAGERMRSCIPATCCACSASFLLHVNTKLNVFLGNFPHTLVVTQ